MEPEVQKQAEEKIVKTNIPALQLPKLILVRGYNFDLDSAFPEPELPTQVL